MTLLYYNFINEFKKQYYLNSLDIEHLQGDEIEIKKLSLPDGGVDEEANFWGYVLKKDNVKYLLSSHSFNIKEDLPIIPRTTEKVAFRGQVYHLIRKYDKLRIRPEKRMSFRELVDKLSYFKHSNPSHQKLLVLISMTQGIDKANFRISTPAGMGKDSSILVFNYLFGGSSSIVSPTIPKLEFLTSIVKWLAINEVVDLSPDQWRTIEQYLLDVGDGKPEIVKHSRGYGTVGEVINTSNFSLSLFYNDIDCYPDSAKYVDFVAKRAVLDRFPALRLYGRIQEDFNSAKNIEVSSWVSNHIEEYKDLLHTFSYYKKFYLSERKYYKVNIDFNTLYLGNHKVSERWKINLSRLFVFLELYCNSQDEFDRWCNIVVSSMIDYAVMLNFPRTYDMCVKKFKDDESRIKHILEDTKLFKDKLSLLNNYSKTGNFLLNNDKLW